MTLDMMDNIITTALEVLPIFLFSLGVWMIIASESLIIVLIGIELILNAAITNFVIHPLQGQGENGLLIFYILVIAVCETCVILSLMYVLKKKYGITSLKNIA